MLCLVLVEKTIEDNIKALAKNAAFIDLCEVRVDRLDAEFRAQVPELLHRIHVEFGKRSILTIRTSTDGGSWQAGDDERRGLFGTILASGDARKALFAIDLEIGTSWPEIELAARDSGIRLIRSLHDFEGGPASTESVAELAKNTKQDSIFKAAYMCRGNADLLGVLEAARTLKDLGRDYIVLGMGEFGSPTRILAHRMGCILGYTSDPLETTASAAPGQLVPKILEERYRFSRINAGTRVFGIIGNPIAHSKSPEFHNKAFAEAKRDAVFVPFLVDDVQAFMECAEVLDVQGLSVTVPFKEDVRRFLSEEDSMVSHIGACNTMLRTTSGSWAGKNTDAPGFFSALEGALPLAQPRCCVIGAGGASRAVIAALLDAGLHVTLFNRTVEKAEQLSHHFSTHFPGKIEVAALPAADAAREAREAAGTIVAGSRYLIVQCSSLGMEGKFEHEDPLSFYRFKGDEIVYDIVYTPEITALLGRAKAEGARIITGTGMFAAQAALQSKDYLELT